MEHLQIINFTFVLVYGVVLSLSFADVPLRHRYKEVGVILLLFFGLQAMTYFLLDGDALFKSYPFFIHLPLFLLLRFYYKKETLISLVAVLSAYLFCSPRKWFGTAMAAVCYNNQDVSYITQILITIPLMVLIVRTVSPYVARLKVENNAVLRCIVIVPILYYIMSYALTVYTN